MAPHKKIKETIVFQLLVVLSSIVYVRCFTQAEHKTKLPIGQHHIHLMMHMFKSKPRWLTKQENGLQIFCVKTRHIKHLPGVQIF